MQIGTILDHKQALSAYTAAGHPFPEIPKGRNTVWHHFQLPDGSHAVILNQCGIAPEAADNEQEVNGCSLLVAIDAADAATARATLDAAVRDLLGIKDTKIVWALPSDQKGRYVAASRVSTVEGEKTLIGWIEAACEAKLAADKNKPESPPAP